MIYTCSVFISNLFFQCGVLFNVGKKAFWFTKRGMLIYFGESLSQMSIVFIQLCLQYAFKCCLAFLISIKHFFLTFCMFVSILCKSTWQPCVMSVLVSFQIGVREFRHICVEVLRRAITTWCAPLARPNKLRCHVSQFI